MEFKPTNWFVETVNMHLHVIVHVTMKTFPIVIDCYTHIHPHTIPTHYIYMYVSK